MNKLLLITTSLIIISCARMKTIGQKEHSFNEATEKIVWIQVAGLELEHMALLRFNKSDSIKPLSMERATCVGNTWSYNLYDLRPEAFKSLNGQLMGTTNVSGECKDLSHKPLWSYLSEFDYKTILIESGITEESSLTQFEKCSEFPQFIAGATLIKMSAPKSGYPTFHFQETKDVDSTKVYYDKSCSVKDCHSSLYSNAISSWEKFIKKSEKGILIIRDFSYFNNLKVGNIVRAQEILTDIERLYSYFEQQKVNGLLLLVSSAESFKLNFPPKGEKWLGYINQSNSMIRRSSLNSVVLAKGAKAENFCGVYNEAEILEKMLWLPEEKKYFEGFFNN